jgi:Amt family ammonium transporter
MTVEWLKTGKPGLVGIVTGMVAGLATITPASGNVGPLGAILLGFLAGLICYFACSFVKGVLRIDDTLDVFAVHGVGGMMGSTLVAVFGSAAFGGTGVDDISRQLRTQLVGVVATALWTALITAFIVVVVRAVTGLRVITDHENMGLDQSAHGESAYNLD